MFVKAASDEQLLGKVLFAVVEALDTMENDVAATLESHESRVHQARHEQRFSYLVLFTLI